MTFDMQAAREICIKLGLRYPARALIDDDYQCALAAEMLPAALDHIDELEKALIEERSQWNAICKDVGTDPHDRYCTTEDDYPEAREQLHAEGLI